MAYIPVNPERRDPGYFKKKADIGLSNVDNMSAAEFVNAVSEDIKILNNKKKFSSKITKKGEFFGGIIKTNPGNSHAEFTLGLFDSLDQSRELATVHIDLIFSCPSPDEVGHLTYTIGCPDKDPYLENLYIVFSQVQDQLYVSLYSASLPDRTSQNYFNLVGIRMIDWTEGVERLDTSKDISEIVRTTEFTRIRLNKSSSNIGTDFADSLSIYDADGKKVLIENVSSLENLDYPSINDVPFLGKKDFKVGNKEAGRNIIVPAYHKDSTREGAGEHDWEVLSNLFKPNYDRENDMADKGESTLMPNNFQHNFGLVRPSKYQEKEPPFDISISTVNGWLNKLGEDTDVITVGAFRECMFYILSLLSGEEVLYGTRFCLDDTANQFIYLPSKTSTYDLLVKSDSFSKNVGGKSEIRIENTCPWITVSEIWDNKTSRYKITINAKANTGPKRTASFRIVQVETEREIEINLIQEAFVVRYGILLGGTPYYEDTNNSLTRWSNSKISLNLPLIPIKSSQTDSRGYEEIEDFEEITLTNENTWFSSKLSSNSDSITLTAEANTKSSVLTGTFYVGIKENEDSEIKYIPVSCSQSSATPYLYIDGNTNKDSVILLSSGKEETSKRYKISSNYTWSVSENTKPSWITLSGYTGERPAGTSYLTLILSENNTQSTREAELELVNKGGIKRRIKVIQTARTVYIDINNQNQDQFFCFSTNEKFKDSSITIEVNSNINWFIDQCPSWIVPSLYDGGEQGTVTNITLVLTAKTGPERLTNQKETISLSYYDEESQTIMSLRKIVVQSDIENFIDSSYYVLPQSPLETEITAEGGTVTFSALTNTKYKAKFLDKIGIWGPISEYPDMLVDYGTSEYVSENPKSTGVTYITFGITKNNNPNERELRFVLVPESYDDEYVEESDYPIFTVTQKGNKEIIPFVQKGKELISTSLQDNLWVYRYTGEVTDERPITPVRNPRLKFDSVYDSSYVKKGQIIILNNTDSSAVLYKTPGEVPSVGDTMEYVNKVVWGETYGWYIVEEDGYYFSTNGEFDLITPSFNSYSTNSSKQDITFSILSALNNRWDLYNDDLPSWISFEKISGNSNYDSFKIIVDENVREDYRNIFFQFYVDAAERTLASFNISQTGVEVSRVDVVSDVLPILSTGKTSYLYTGFEVGLSALVRYNTRTTVNDVEYSYTTSEYKNQNIEFSVEVISGDETGVLIESNKLIVNENISDSIRTIRVTANYDGGTGTIDILQGSKKTLQFYTYSDLNILPSIDNTIPIGITSFGFEIEGIKILNTLNLETGELSTITEASGENIRFPYPPEMAMINECGFSLLTPESISYSGSIKDEVIISYPMLTYSIKEGVIEEEIIYVDTNGEEFISGVEDNVVTVDNTLMSGSKPGTELSEYISFTFDNIKVERIDSSSDTNLYLSSNILTTETYSHPFRIKVKLEDELKEYIENKIITFAISNNNDIQKYIHFRYLRALPSINTKNTEISYSGDQTIAKIGISSNIGYNSFSISNNNDGVYIENGYLTTSSAKLDDLKVIKFTSSSQPSRKWYQKYSTESLILKDSDYYGLTKEIPIILPLGTGSISGFEAKTDTETITTFEDSSISVSYDLYLPYTGGDSIVKIKSYDIYTVNGITTSSLLTITDSRNWIRSKVGSLDEMNLTIGYSGTNSSNNSILRGTVIVKSTTKTLTLNIYQLSRTGVATIISPLTKTYVIGANSNDVTFSHLYPGWFIIPTVNGIENSSTILNYTYPKVNNRNFNLNYGSGGNSGITYTNQDGLTSTVKLSYSSFMSHISNTSLELKSVSECIDTIKTPSEYGIKTAPVNILQTSPSTINVTDILKIMVKPNDPSYTIYQMEDDTLVQQPEILKIKTKIVNDPIAQQSKPIKYLDIYINSDLFDRTTPYIGKTLKINNESVSVYDSSTIYNLLFNPIIIEYGFSPISSGDATSILSNTKKIYSPSNYTEIDGKIYARYELTFGTTSSIIVGKSTFQMNAYTVDPNYYQEDKVIEIVLSIIDESES